MNPDSTNQRQIAIWLFCICILIFSMVILGGVTRLTHSGLSMVEWKPIVGVIPPIGESEWQETFDKYKQFPEYKKKNMHMNLGEFKTIFYFEYGHRVLGRLIGLSFLVPFLYFLARKKIKRNMTPRFIIMFLLGGLQGLLGWYMVKSGLVNNPHVSQYRLTAHLSAAIAIYGYVFWVALGFISPTPKNTSVSGIKSIRNLSILITAVVAIMIISGGFVAGTRAGLAYNTFPLMAGQFFPPGLYNMEPFHLNLFEDLTTIQFNHRIIAYLLCILIPLFWFKTRAYSLSNRTRLGLNLLLIMLAMQVGLGISTLLLAVPVTLAATHQAGALVLFTLALLVNHQLRAGSSI
ncbi:MAG: COX15/CtaA family protein [Gammaproteobacteria bacterium]|nr:COX15/CtaA family protein [Gammaproteobacteria bacterium]